MERALKLLPNQNLKYVLAERYYEYGSNLSDDIGKRNKAIEYLRRSLELHVSTKANDSLAFLLEEPIIEKANELIRSSDRLWDPSNRSVRRPLRTSIITDYFSRREFQREFDREVIICEYCGNPIVWKYFTPKFEGKSHNMCLECMDEIQSKLATTLGKLKECLHDLKEAHKLLPNHENYKANFNDLSKIISNREKSIKMYHKNENKIVWKDILREKLRGFSVCIFEY